jgi:hypothetical protein
LTPALVVAVEEVADEAARFRSLVFIAQSATGKVRSVDVHHDSHVVVRLGGDGGWCHQRDALHELFSGTWQQKWKVSYTM